MSMAQHLEVYEIKNTKVFLRGFSPPRPEQVTHHTELLAAGDSGVEAQRRHHTRRRAADLGMGRQRRLPGANSFTNDVTCCVVCNRAGLTPAHMLTEAVHTHALELPVDLLKC